MELLWPLLAWAAWSQTTTVEADTKFEGTALASDLLLVVGSATDCAGGHEN
jgi:hypothetical protein